MLRYVFNNNKFEIIYNVRGPTKRDFVRYCFTDKLEMLKTLDEIIFYVKKVG